MKKKLPKQQKSNFFHSKLFFILLFSFSTVLIFIPLLYKDQLSQLRSLGLIGLFLINFLGSATVLLPAPAIFSVGVAGNIYNPFLVAVIASVASTLGEGTGFLFGYTSKEIANLQKHKVVYFLFNLFFKKYGFALIIFFSVIPNPFIDGIGIFAGLSGYSWKRYFLWVFVGRIIRNVVIAYISHKL